MEFRLLGPLEVDDRGRSLPIGGAKQRALLALLLLDAGRVVPAERLIDELWGERPPESAPNILQGYVSHLRDALEPGRARGESRILLTRGGGYVLEADADDIDVRRAERLREQARASTNPEEALRLLDEALALWRGPPLADLAYEPFAQPEVRRLDELRLALMEERFEADLAEGRHNDAVGDLNAFVERHPLRERGIALLMVALYRSGRQAEALDAYRRARRRLDEELGLEPGDDLRRLHAAILRHDAELAAPAAQRAGSRRRGHRVALAVAAAVALIALLTALVTRGGSPAVAIASNQLVVLDEHTGRIERATPVGIRPVDVALAGSVAWVVNSTDRTVSPVDVRNGHVLRTIRLDRPPSSIAVWRGSTWVASPGEIDRIDRATDRIVLRIRLPRALYPAGVPIPDISAGPAGLWAATGTGIYAVSAEGTLKRFFESVDTKDPALAVGHDELWIATSGLDHTTGIGAPRISHLELSGITRSAAAPAAPGGLTVALGSLWVSIPEQRRVLRLDAQTVGIVAAIDVGCYPDALAAGREAVWIACRDGAVLRIDDTGAVERVARLDVKPTSIAVDAAHVLVTVAE